MDNSGSIRGATHLLSVTGIPASGQPCQISQRIEARAHDALVRLQGETGRMRRQSPPSANDPKPTSSAAKFWSGRNALRGPSLVLTADRHRGAPSSTRLLDRGLKLLRQRLDDARAKANVGGVVTRFLGTRSIVGDRESPARILR